MAQISAVVVTFNRKMLLLRCLNALIGQSHALDRILIVDNASTDGTRKVLADDGWLARENVELLALEENTGGAGGFAAGLRRAVDSGSDWVWMMDDDAEPHKDALEQLITHADDPRNIYGSVALQGKKLSWIMMPLKGDIHDGIEFASQLPDEIAVQFIPFLGILISSKLVSSIGVPDAGFFIAADDVDYCMRAQEHGSKVILVGRSRIEHPAAERYCLRTPFRRFYSLRLPPWKRYYDVRNRIFVARSHYGAALYYKTIPGSVLRLITTLWYEDRRWQQVKAFFAGMIDGLLNKKGRRHQLWGINP